MANSDGHPNRYDLQLFSGTNNAEDMFLATISELDKELSNQLKVDHPLWEYLQDKNLIKYQSDISTDISVPLLDKPNSTVKDFTAYDDADLTPQDATSKAQFLWGHIAGTQMYNREELAKNSDKYKLLDLIEAKTLQLKESINNHFAVKLMGDQDSDGRVIMGIGRILKKDQTCGGIDPTKSGFAYWNPQYTVKGDGNKFSLGTKADYRAAMRKQRRECTCNNMSPDVYFMGEDVWDAHCSWAEDKAQVSLTPEQAEKFAGYEMLIDNGRFYAYNENLPAKTVWALNFKNRGVELRIHKETNFSFQPWESTGGKIQSKHRHCLLYAATTCRKRNLNGVLEFD
ncbi:hypothetical protein CI610_01379 [invertebrate metagenome]|uniref:Major capsid protein n=1 Tax=invertebrate metagenome TaxID=1711999 RepID=A0A2H9T8T6_9ZZZZ